jgi:hypothetical protein
MAAAALFLCSCSPSSDDAVASCTRRGIAYFKEIGSWPQLSDGRDAATVAAERCRRTVTAFP